MAELITEHTGSTKTVNVTVRKSHIIDGEKQFATVNRNTATLENIIAAVHKNNPLISENIIRTVATEFKIAMLEKLQNGEGLNLFDLGTLYLTSKGSIESENPTAEDVPAFGVGFTPTKTAKFSVSDIEIDSLEKAETSPSIASFTDLSTNKNGFEITEGGGMKISGERLKIAGNNDATGVFFAPALESGKIDENEENWKKVSRLFRNFPKDLSFLLPEDAKAESKWFIVVRTASSWGSRTTSSLKTSISKNPISVVSA